MKGDFSRWSYLKDNRYCAVLQQQGRVQVDADWNEQQEINQHRVETEAADVIGKSGTPADDPGFGITTDGANIYIGKGRYYVDGILCENPDEKVAYDKQKDLPRPRSLENISRGLVFLHVWKRHITVFDDPHIQEKALDGPDTCTRAKTIWQVWVLPLNEKEFKAAIENCNAGLAKWARGTSASSALMNAKTMDVGEELPCRLPPSSGYKKLENQLYRVEIHKGGPIEEATFKWSRDNGSIVTSITSINGSEIKVADLGRDDVLGFKEGNWVEISDDHSELTISLTDEISGLLTKIVKIDHATNTIILEDDLKNLFSTRLHAKIRRWDQNERTASLDSMPTPDGIRITGDWQHLEGGIYVKFEPGSHSDIMSPEIVSPKISEGISEGIVGMPDKWELIVEDGDHRDDAAEKERLFSNQLVKLTEKQVAPQGVKLKERSLRTGDFWLIPARTATREIEWPPFEVPNTNPLPQPPLGIEHHFCRMALISRNEDGKLEVVKDCRNKFPPLIEAPTKDRGIHIVNVMIGNGDSVPTLGKNAVVYKPLNNGDVVWVNQLIEGLKIECDQEIDPSIDDDLSEMRKLPNPRFSVSLELPIPYIIGALVPLLSLGIGNVGIPAEFFVGAGDTFVRDKNSRDMLKLNLIQILNNLRQLSLGFISFALAANVRSEGKTIRWTAFHKELMVLLANHPLFKSILAATYGADNVPVLARLTIKGNFIYSKSEPGILLDGETFGDGPDMDMRLPSGDGRRGGDFEMWFWVRAERPQL
ncbi:MAG: hypothetical protein A4E45_01462 [Methanosaeta sp. PtaB.Bin039]|nr:MAG: hypothetical protein A4E45_01462 [Methanosaeta sp. PtaB.Bin039]